MLKDGTKRPKSPTIGFRSKRGKSGQWNTSLVKYVHEYERSSICPLSTTLASPESSTSLPPSLSFLPPLSHNGPFTLRYPAALRDACHFSARFNLRKIPATATYQFIRTDLPRVDARYACARSVCEFCVFYLLEM